MIISSNRTVPWYATYDISLILLFVHDVVKGWLSKRMTTIKKSDKTDPITAVQDSIGTHDPTVIYAKIYA